MLDLITFAGPYELKQRAAARIRASFRDTAANADVVPANVYYRLDDDSTGLVLVDWTPVTPPVLPTNYVDIALTGEQDRNVTASRSLERKTLSVMTDRGLATQNVASYTFSVRALAWFS